MTNETERAGDAGVEGTEERAEELRAIVAFEAWHSGPGVKPSTVLAATVDFLGITPEMVERFRHDLHTADDIKVLRVLLRAAGRSER